MILEIRTARVHVREKETEKIQGFSDYSERLCTFSAFALSTRFIFHLAFLVFLNKKKKAEILGTHLGTALKCRPGDGISVFALPAG